jgi:hypothetical protein
VPISKGTQLGVNANTITDLQVCAYLFQQGNTKSLVFRVEKTGCEVDCTSSHLRTAAGEFGNSHIAEADVSRRYRERCHEEVLGAVVEPDKVAERTNASYYVAVEQALGDSITQSLQDRDIVRVEDVGVDRLNSLEISLGKGFIFVTAAAEGEEEEKGESNEMKEPNHFQSNF